MVYVEVMLGKHVNWSTMTAHSRSDITEDKIAIPTNVDWNGGLMQHAITNRLLRQGWVVAVETPRSPQVHTGMEDRAWDHHFTGGSEQYEGWESWDPQGREGVISTEHGMITTRAERLNTQREKHVGK
jgi:hypothetical protein